MYRRDFGTNTTAATAFVKKLLTEPVFIDNEDVVAMPSVPRKGELYTLEIVTEEKMTVARRYTVYLCESTEYYQLLKLRIGINIYNG